MKMHALLALDEKQAAHALKTMKLKTLESLGEKIAKQIGSTAYSIWLSRAIKLLGQGNLAYDGFLVALFGEQNQSKEERIFGVILMLVVRHKFEQIHNK